LFNNPSILSSLYLDGNLVSGIPDIVADGGNTTAADTMQILSLSRNPIIQLPSSIDELV
jgi:Leucine-rich repeat (LRR) protein